MFLQKDLLEVLTAVIEAMILFGERVPADVVS